MKAGTERTLKTLVYLAIVGAGAYWAYGNVLPLLTRKLQQTGSIPKPTLNPQRDSTPTPDSQTPPLGNTITDIGGFAHIPTGGPFSDFAWAHNNGLSDTGKTAAAVDGDVVIPDPVEEFTAWVQRSLGKVVTHPQVPTTPILPSPQAPLLDWTHNSLSSSPDIPSVVF